MGYHNTKNCKEKNQQKNTITLIGNLMKEYPSKPLDTKMESCEALRKALGGIWSKQTHK